MNPRKTGALLLILGWTAALADSAMTEFYPGQKAFLDSRSASNSFAVVFEDDGTTGYFYVLDTSNMDQMTLDAVHISNAEDVTGRDKSSTTKEIRSASEEQAALLINDCPHAVFDFVAKRGYCRTGFPPPSHNSSSEGHEWDDGAMKFFE